jgi:hypothetical protein
MSSPAQWDQIQYHHAQRVAIETIIYSYEVAGVRRQKDLIEKYAGSNQDLRLLQYYDFARYPDRNGHR